jgi:leucyl-tRNA synthetase
MRQWMLRMTAYAEQLLEGLDRIDWPEPTKTGQRDRIGRSEGAEIAFEVQGHAERLEVFTTRPDTLWGATYMVMAPEHPFVERFTTDAQRAAVEAYRERTARMSEIDRQTTREKTGVDIGARAINPATNEAIPIWIADYVIYGYGTGAIMAVPAHDQRDWEFAQTMGLPIVDVISGREDEQGAHTGEGVMINSGPLDGTPTAGGEAVRKTIDHLEQLGVGRARVTYKLRDWTFARQRYWGEPIPVLKDGHEIVRTLTVDELPLELPMVDDFAPTGTGESPLARARDWVEVDDPVTGRHLRRETDTMPGSAGSSWYFLRYCDPHNDRELCAREKSDYWMPVDLYVGGPEHTVGHLLYARMWQKALFDEGVVRDDEPFAKLRHQGMIQAFVYYDPEGRIVPWAEVDDRGGQFFRAGTDVPLEQRIEKMSKRKGNVVNPDEIIDQFGADAMRVYIAFLGPLEQDKPWAPGGIEAQRNFLKRFWRLFFDDEDRSRVTEDAPAEADLRVVHKAIAKVSDDIEKLAINTAISALHVATKELTASGATGRAVLEPLAQLMAPFAPHIAEEIWCEALGHRDGISFHPWPEADPAYVADDLVTMGVQVLGKTRGEIRISRDADEATAVAAAQAEPSVQRHLDGKSLVRVIYKPGKILNLIAK